MSKYKEKVRANLQVPVKMSAYEKSVQKFMKKKEYWKNWDDEESHWTVCLLIFTTLFTKTFQITILYLIESF